jgi:O-antigen/teichoic acid export membrane protein
MKRRTITSSDALRAGLAYAYSSGISLILQLCIIWVRGGVYYEEIGLVYLLLMSIIFLGDLGYNQLFLRESKLDGAFKHDWQLSLGHKLLATLVLILFLFLYVVSQRGIHSNSLIYLCLSSLGLLFYCLTPTTLLYSQSRNNIAVLVLPIQQSITVLPCLILVFSNVDDYIFSAFLGLMFAIGYIGAFVFVHGKLKSSEWIKPKFALLQYGRMKESLYLWQLGLSGMVYDRTLLFFIEHLRPDFLAVFIFLNQVLQGMSGIIVQIQKITIPKFKNLMDEFRGAGVRKELISHVAFYLVLILGVHIVGLGYLDLSEDSIVSGGSILAALVISEWVCRALTTTCISALLVYRLERYIRDRLVVYQIGFGFIQIALSFYLVSIIPILVLRVCLGMLVLYLFFRKLRIHAITVLSLAMVVWIPLSIYIWTNHLALTNSVGLLLISFAFICLVFAVTYYLTRFGSVSKEQVAR